MSVTLSLSSLIALQCRCGDDTLLVVKASSTVQLVRVRGTEAGVAHAHIKLMHAASAAAFCKETNKLAVAHSTQVRRASNHNLSA